MVHGTEYGIRTTATTARTPKPPDHRSGQWRGTSVRYIGTLVHVQCTKSTETLNINH